MARTSITCSKCGRTFWTEHSGMSETLQRRDRSKLESLRLRFLKHQCTGKSPTWAEGDAAFRAGKVTQ